jgi:hypothetical protein
MRLRHHLVIAFVVIACGSALLDAQSYSVARTGNFGPQHKKILLLQNSTGQKPIILFRTTLRVNTDGSPLSYHPQDLRGRDKALNNICNAVVVKKTGSNENLCRTRAHFGEAIGVFEGFRDAKYQRVPDGFQITWANVLPAVKAQGKDVPCVFTSGAFQGYFGSMTALKNGVTGDKGECDINDQVNPMAVPALVLVGGNNPVKAFGARVGDLLVAYNPKTRLFSSAIIGDTGPEDNLGEGSVSLNMKLLGATVPPTNKAETFKLSIENTQVFVAIIPASRAFREVKPYTMANIDARVREWQTEAGFASPEKFIDLMTSFEADLR